MPTILGFVPDHEEKIKIRGITEKINQIIHSDPFLRNEIDPNKLVKKFIENPKFKYSVRSFVSPQFNKLVVNVSLLDNPVSAAANAFSDSRLLTQLYRIPGERRAILVRPSVNRKLKNWHVRLEDELFPLYCRYEPTFIFMGLNKGVMLNHPRLVNEIYDISSHLVEVDILQQILHFPKDYLFHSLLGVQMIWPAFLLANQREKGEKPKVELEEVYELSHSSVIEKIIDHGNLIAENDPFNEYFYPSLLGEINYSTLANKFLEDSIEIRKLNPHVSQVRFNQELENEKMYFLDCLKRQDYVS